MKILFLANHFNTGGITSYLITLTRALTGRGHKVCVATSGGNMVSALELMGAKHVCFGFNVKSEIHPALFLQVPRLTGLIRNEKIDIIHAQTRVTQMGAALASKFSGVPYVSTCHGFFKPHPGRLLLALWGRRVIAISAPVHDHLTQDFHLPVKQIALIPNGIDLQLFTPIEQAARIELRRHWQLADFPTVGIVARLSDVKGHEFLIDAMPQVLSVIPNAKCLIFGDGPLESSLKAKVKSLALEDSIKFYPVVNRTAEILPLIDIFVMPSLQEGLGLAVLEAAAMGIPAVVSRVGGLPDVVKDGITGILVPSKDSRAIAQAIITLLSDPGYTKTLGQNARDFVCKRFSADVMSEGTLLMYKNILDK
jgi:glycosyltransferase involved in cell wall biosynthesis